MFSSSQIALKSIVYSCSHAQKVLSQIHLTWRGILILSILQKPKQWDQIDWSLESSAKLRIFAFWMLLKEKIRVSWFSFSGDDFRSRNLSSYVLKRWFSCEILIWDKKRVYSHHHCLNSTKVDGISSILSIAESINALFSIVCSSELDDIMIYLNWKKDANVNGGIYFTCGGIVILSILVFSNWCSQKNLISESSANLIVFKRDLFLNSDKLVIMYSWDSLVMERGKKKSSALIKNSITLAVLSSSFTE